MAARRSSSSSEDLISEESDTNNINFYGSDVEDSFVPLEECGPRPYRFEPRRVRRNEANDEEEDSADPNNSDRIDRLGNTNWYPIF